MPEIAPPVFRSMATKGCGSFPTRRGRTAERQGSVVDPLLRRDRPAGGARANQRPAPLPAGGPADTRGDRDRAESRAQPERDRLLLRATPGDRAATEQLRDVAEKKLPVLREAIERAEIVRRWLEDAARYCCPTLDDCPWGALTQFVSGRAWRRRSFTGAVAVASGFPPSGGCSWSCRFCTSSPAACSRWWSYSRAGSARKSLRSWC